MDSFDSQNTAENEDKKRTLGRKLSESRVQTISTSADEEKRVSSYASLIRLSTWTRKKKDEQSRVANAPKFPKLQQP
jgi:hypothetical protein